MDWMKLKIIAFIERSETKKNSYCIILIYTRNLYEIIENSI